MAYTVGTSTDYCPNNQGGSGFHEPMTVTIGETAKAIVWQEKAGTDDADEVMLNVKLSICKHCRAVYYVDKIDYSAA